ncbi:TPR like protein [Aspergillus terreus]|uniref:TPR like protein n=1 Tax=Aspergillus terreus TaxID=33178 RepID=A0A5M3YNQ4_ASPTE|nr:hypothetical protein ATETN484_0001007900 [Aspergillus terreus]GFF11860.1 TPR like protein [Aspergillus terreus]
MKDWGTKHKGPKKTVYFDIGGKGGGGLRDLYSFHTTRRYKEYYRKNAEECDKKRRSGYLVGALPLSRGWTSPVAHATTLKKLILDPDTVSRYLEILEENSISVESYLEDASEMARKQEQMAGDFEWTEAFDEQVRDLEEKIVGKMSEKEKREMYENIERMVSCSAPDDSGITAQELGLDEPQARQYYLVQELLDRFAAKVQEGRDTVPA